MARRFRWVCFGAALVIASSSSSVASQSTAQVAVSRRPVLSPTARQIFDAAIAAARLVPGLGNAVNWVDAILKASFAIDSAIEDAAKDPRGATIGALKTISTQLERFEAARQNLIQVVASAPQDRTSLERVRVLQSAVTQARVTEATIVARLGEMTDRMTKLEASVDSLSAQERADVARLSERIERIESILGIGASLTGREVGLRRADDQPSTEQLAYWAYLEEEAVSGYLAMVQEMRSVFGWDSGDFAKYSLPLRHSTLPTFRSATFEQRRRNAVEITKDLARASCINFVRVEQNAADVSSVAQVLLNFEAAVLSRGTGNGLRDEQVVQQYRRFLCARERGLLRDLAEGDQGFVWFQSIVALPYIPPEKREDYISSIEAELAKAEALQR